jgi:hypothetical protein
MNTQDDRVRPDEEIVLLMKTWTDGEAEMVRQLLASYGIPCQVVSDITHAIYPFTVDGLGEIQILVPASSLESARNILDDHRRAASESAGENGAESLSDNDDPAAPSES